MVRALALVAVSLAAACAPDPPPLYYPVYGNHNVPNSPYGGGYTPQPYPQPTAAPLATPQQAPPASPLAEARAYALSRTNQIRAQNGRPPYAEDACLDGYAAAGSAELAQDHRAHAHFEAGGFPCGCGAMAENQGDPGGWLPEPTHQAIDEILASMMSEGPGGGHYENLLSTTYRRGGVGLVLVGQTLYFTSDFCE